MLYLHVVIYNLLLSQVWCSSCKKTHLYCSWYDCFGFHRSSSTFGLAFNKTAKLLNETVEHNGSSLYLGISVKIKATVWIVKLHLVIYVNRKWKTKCIWWQLNIRVNFWCGIYISNIYSNYSALLSTCDLKLNITCWRSFLCCFVMA